MDHLHNNKLRVLLVFDEVDQLYRVSDKTSDEALDVIGDFSSLGNSNAGLVSTILCGSSGALPILISGKRHADYPLSQKSPPNLNASKFPSFHVSQPPFTAEEMVAVLEEFFPQMTGSESEKQNILSFFFASNLRRMSQWQDNQKKYFRSIVQDAMDNRADETREKYSKLITTVNHGLWRANKDIFEGLHLSDTQSGSLRLDTERIASVSWQTRITPLNTQPLMNSDPTTKAQLQHLVDKGGSRPHLT
eukprot:c56380_g1_i1.p1 GENE.c56380_g1_i1~~c56380_g1_i1.p1  ORF type:complete len:248 (+),score=45.24 c56380_g1_i1:500-1243(+)